MVQKNETNYIICYYLIKETRKYILYVGTWNIWSYWYNRLSFFQPFFLLFLGMLYQRGE